MSIYFLVSVAFLVYGESNLIFDRRVVYGRKPMGADPSLETLPAK